MSETDDAFEIVRGFIQDVTSRDSVLGVAAGAVLESLASLRTQLQQAEQERDVADRQRADALVWATTTGALQLKRQLQQAEARAAELEREKAVRGVFRSADDQITIDILTSRAEQAEARLGALQEELDECRDELGTDDSMAGSDSLASSNADPQEGT